MVKKCKNCIYFTELHYGVGNRCGWYGLFGYPTNAYANEEDYKNGIMIPPKDEETSAETCIHFKTNKK